MSQTNKVSDSDKAADAFAEEFIISGRHMQETPFVCAIECFLAGAAWGRKQGLEEAAKMAEQITKRESPAVQEVATFVAQAIRSLAAKE